jgi:hypothetical protein
MHLLQESKETLLLLGMMTKDANAFIFGEWNKTYALP